MKNKFTCKEFYHDGPDDCLSPTSKRPRSFSLSHGGEDVHQFCPHIETFLKNLPDIPMIYFVMRTIACVSDRQIALSYGLTPEEVLMHCVQVKRDMRKYLDEVSQKNRKFTFWGILRGRI